ncbi:MORN motif protein (macronuclear) [Tetrahymena thermophila SB210]|uniref:MORN motif protein n=1 Tax=Tetrahymena thermophila (strain SB210) TaxID=312017 RepID=I7LZS5_TETTS|nr:MORN motif protein [Tetrahymena thermophila SB210]EAR84831.3 MORN motif protein [Tetrahymena thermophila SB210]|eukprot:XP_001032494.3 MORN motif protein [Tetrahymena thermophila SB210]
MKKLFNMFSSRPHYNIEDVKTPSNQNYKVFDADCSAVPIFENQMKDISYINADRGSTLEINRVNEEDTSSYQAAPIQVISPQAPQKIINQKIKTVRIRLIQEKQSKSSISNSQEKYKAEVKAKDQCFKQIAKTIYIFYTAEDLLAQLATCSYFNGFKPLNYNHIKQCLFPSNDCNDQNAQKQKKKSSIQVLKYYITQTDEGEYHGQMNKNKVPEGNSILFYKNGNQYIGEMKNRFRNGQGSMFYPDGSSYTGGWVLDAKEGQGKETETKGEVFTGNFINNCRSGKGQLIYKNGYVLESNWINGYQDGLSTLSVGKQQIQVLFCMGQIVKINSTPIQDLQNVSNENQNITNLIQINFCRDQVQVFKNQPIPSYLTARF